MNDFLKGLRSSGKDKRYDRNNRRSYNGNSHNPQYNGKPQYNGHPQYRGNEQVNGNLKRPSYGGNEALAVMLEEALPEIKVLIQNIAENQKRLVEAEERRAKAEEAKAAVMENLADSLKTLIKSGFCSSNISADKSVKKTNHSNANDRQTVLNIIFSMRDNGSTYDQIATHLEAENIPTFSGKGKWHAQTIHRVCQKYK